MMRARKDVGETLMEIVLTITIIGLTVTGPLGFHDDLAIKVRTP